MKVSFQVSTQSGQDWLQRQKIKERHTSTKGLHKGEEPFDLFKPLLWRKAPLVAGGGLL